MQFGNFFWMAFLYPALYEHLLRKDLKAKTESLSFSLNCFWKGPNDIKTP